METKINVYPENQYTEINIRIPFCKRQKGSDFDIDKCCKQREAWLFDLIGSYRDVIIASLERRMQSCQNNLIRHIGDVVESDEYGHIVYRRKDSSEGNFNTYSFNEMQDAVKALKQSCWREYINNPFWIDQTIKAFLNDTVQDHSDKGIFKYSDLVSFLCEVHLNGFQH